MSQLRRKSALGPLRSIAEQLERRAGITCKRHQPLLAVTSCPTMPASPFTILTSHIFSSYAAVSQVKHGTKLEWIVIILILVEAWIQGLQGKRSDDNDIRRHAFCMHCLLRSSWKSSSCTSHLLVGERCAQRHQIGTCSPQQNGHLRQKIWCMLQHYMY